MGLKWLELILATSKKVRDTRLDTGLQLTTTFYLFFKDTKIDSRDDCRCSKMTSEQTHS